jgi:hypothetical protein
MVVTQDGVRGIPARTLSAFEAVAHLFKPIDERLRSVIVEADDSWRVDLPDKSEADVIVWGKPQISKTSAPLMVRWATQRELALRAAGRHTPSGMRVVAIHRLPPKMRAGPVTNLLRRHLLSGGAVTLAAEDPGPTVLQKLIDTVGPPLERDPVRPSGDGSVTVPVLHDGRPAMVRAAADGSGDDPGRNAAALALLVRLGSPLIPAVLGGGRLAGVNWTLETLVGGKMPGHLSPQLVEDLREFCISLAGLAQGPAQSLIERLGVIAELLPEQRELLERLAQYFQADCERLPAVVQHGDLFLGNVLVQDDRLSGVVDWEIWHPAGLPGVDLLHLFGLARRAVTRAEIGDLWRERFWQSDDFRTAARPYWKALGVEPDARALEAIALDWWCCRMLIKRLALDDPEWAEANAHDVLRRLAGG